MLITDCPSVKRNRPVLLQGLGASSVISLWRVLILSACFSVFSTGTAIASNCGVEFGAQAVSACEKELARNPSNIEVRLTYADVLMGQRQYQKAVKILGDALAMQPGNSTIKKKYRLASSLAEEQQSMANLSDDTPTVGTRNSVKEILCKTLKGQKAINACDQVLKADPRNVAVLTRRGDELMALNRVRSAASSYRRAVALDPGNTTLQNKLTIAKSKMTRKTPVIVVKTQGKDKPAETTKEKLKTEQLQLAEESYMETELPISTTELAVKYSNVSLANGSTY